MKLAKILLLFCVLFVIHETSPLANQISTEITDPNILSALETKGFSFSELIEGKPGQALTNAALYQQPYYHSLVVSLSSDLDQRQSKDSQLSAGIKTAHRLFDKKFLTSAFAHFELVGIINRLDRQVFAPEMGCGEIRFIYRLAYKVGKDKTEIASRLPMTVNVVFWAKGDGLTCSSIASSWTSSDTLTKIIKPDHLKSVEINLQSVRWPSTVRPDFGGYAEYFLQAFQKDPLQKKLVPMALENTPDVKKILGNPSLKVELINFLKNPDNLKKIDAGTLVIPEKFLTKKATSVALHGLSRLANRPFDQILSEIDFNDVKFDNNRYVLSPKALLRRLNDMTCIGCHQGRAIAGFHFVGIDRSGTQPTNSVKVAASPHFINDHIRRIHYNQALISNKEPDFARPFSERSDTEKGVFGAHCGLGDASFAQWTCEMEYHCESNDNPQNSALVGECFPNIPIAGSPCETGEVTQDINPLNDKIINIKKSSCGDYDVCESLSVGFPGGMCDSSCWKLAKGEVCGSIAILVGFNKCTAEEKPYFQCTEENVRPATLKACDEHTACRDDYICMKTAEDKGACIPPYFLFQLRVDGHPRLNQ